MSLTSVMPQHGQRSFGVPDPDNTDPKSKTTPNLHKLNRQQDNAERSVACPLGIYLAD